MLMISTTRWSNGKKLCNEEASEPIFTGSTTIHLNFYADGDVEDRGFWIKYRGMYTYSHHF